MIDATVLNKGVSKWVDKTVKEIIADMYAKGIRHRENSTSKQAIFNLVKGAVRKKFGVANRAAVVFPKHLVYVKYGVGKYRAKGSGKESPKDIVDNIIDKNLPQLADICQEAWADIAVKNIFIDKSRTVAVTK